MKHRARRHDAFLVGQRDGGAARHRGKRGLERCRAHDRHHHHVGRTRGRRDHRLVPAATSIPFPDKRGLQIRDRASRRRSRQACGLDFARLLGERVDIGLRRQGLNGNGVARRTRSRAWAMTSSVLTPMEPVEPST